MAFNKITDVLDIHQQRANQPTESATILKQLYDQDVNTIKTRHNEFIDALESTTDGNSGMDNIGMTPINGVTSITPQGALEELNEKIDEQLPVPDGSITDLKLSNEDLQIKSQVTYIEKVKSVDNFYNEIESNANFKFINDLSLDSAKIITNKIRCEIDFTGVINWENITDGSDPTYDGSKWVYNSLNAIVLDGWEDCKITNLNFIQDKTNTAVKIWSGIVLRNCKNVEISNCLIDGFTWIGILIENTSTDCKIRNNKVYHCRFGIYDNGVRTLVEYNDVSSKYSETQEYIDNGNQWLPPTPTYDSQYYDGLMAFGTNSRYENNDCKDNGQSGIFSSVCSNCLFTSNIVNDNFNVGIDLGAISGTNDILNPLVIGNMMKNNASHQLNLTGVDGAFATGNYIYRSTDDTFGIILTLISNNNTIANNKIIHLGITMASRGISVASTCTNNKVLLNDIDAPTPYSIGGSTNVLFAEDNATIKNKLTVDLSDNTGIDGRRILDLDGSSDNTYVQVASNKDEIRFLMADSTKINIVCGDLDAVAATLSGLVFLSDSARLRLPTTPTAAISTGYLWYDSSLNVLKYVDGTSVKTIATL